MSRTVTVALAIAIHAFAQQANAACYTIYKSDVAIYQSSVPPVDMGPPFSQTVPAKFGVGATMVYQEWANSCAEFDSPTGFDKAPSVARQPQGQARTTESSSSRASSSSRQAQSSAAQMTNSEMVINASQSYGGSGGTASNVDYPGSIQTGPRGGQYYMNSNGNKTYVSSGNSGRSGRR